MIGVRLNSFSDNSGEPEQDANSALTELDKGLRSGKVGEQCEAIVRFPRLFEKYPFPILINSSFLKLADVFRMGNNFLRLWVLRVCQQSEKHLDKILNVDEFLRRVYSVLHSNDPVARALALRTLGAVAGIIPERQNVHHAIRRGLESHDNVEVDAAIYATTRFAAHSNSFAVAMCNKLSDMVECESTGVERRAKLVRALRTVHGGAVRAQGVLKLLRSLLERFPSSSSVRAAITALTAIAADTVVHVPDQVELLLKLAVNDARSAVRRAALVGLRKLAEHAALWPTDCIQDLVHAASEMQDDEHSMLCLQVMQILVRCPAVCAAAGPEASLRRHCSAAALSVNMKLAAIAADVLTRIVAHCYEENLPVEGSELMLALESLVIATGMDNGQNNIRPLRIALRCLVQLSSSAPHLYASRTAGVLGSAAQSSLGPRQAALLEGLAALGALGASAAPYLIPALERAKEDCKDPTYDGTTLVLICTVLLQERAVAALRYRIRGSWEERIKDAVRGADGWTRYRVARTALRYGHHRLAGELLEQLATQAPSEAAQRWLTALHRAAAADRLLEDEGVSALEEASAGWQSFAVGAVGAGVGAGGCVGCAGCGACTSLCAAWAAARARGLAALARAAAAARALCTQPPPAIAMQHAQAARDPASKSGACAGALRRASAALSAVAKSYAALARMSFYADDTTLRLLYISQHTYGLMSQFLERITSGQEWEVRPVSARSLEETLALAPAHALAGVAAQLFDHPATGAGITHRHAEAVVAGVRALCRGIVWPRAVCAGGAGGAPCRVSLSPAPRAPPADHAAALPLAHRLAVKLEGVLLPPPGKMKNKRQVKGVQITVTATPHPRTNEKTVELTNVQPTLTAVQTVTPVRDFFSAQQLVSVPAPGLYTVAVEAAFVDEKGQLWHTGPRSCIVIKVSTDTTRTRGTQISRLNFHPLVNLKEIILDGNNIGRDLLDTSLFDPNGCGLTTAIQSISLNKINLQDVRREYFLQADKLSNLSLSGNNLTTIPYFKQLLHLDLSDNPIEVLEFDQTYPPIISVFKINNLKIKEISMNGLLGLFNEIEMESNRYLSNFSHLAFGSNILRDDYDFITRKLSMRSSNLSSLDERLWVLFKHLEVLDLQDNPWHCDCRISWFLKLNIPLMLSQELKCATPSYFKGIRILDLKPHDFECPQQTVPKTVRYIEGVYELAVTLGLILYTLLLIVTLIWIYFFLYLPRTRVKKNEYLLI